MVNFISNAYCSFKFGNGPHFSEYRKAKNIVLVVLLFLIIIPLNSYPANKGKAENRVKNIVIFFSLNAAVPAYQNFLDGFNSAFPQYYEEQCNVLIEYLDIGRDADNAYLKHIIKMYNEKFGGNKIDLIITVGPGTYPLLKKNGLNALLNTPTIEVDLEKLSVDSQYDIEKKYVYEIKIVLDFGKTFTNAFDLFPDIRNVYIICGSSSTDQYYVNLARQAAQPFEGKYKFSFINGISMDSTLQIVTKIPENSIVVIPSYMTDINNTPISTTFALNTISNQCIAPLFTASDNFIKKGGIGGCVFSFFETGKETGRVASELLKGKQLKDITLNESNFYQYIYDWRELKRWNLLNSKAIPSNSTYLNKEFDFITEYKWYLLLALVFAILESFLIVFLFRVNRRQKEFMKQKAENDMLYRELIRDERLLRMAELTASLSHELNQPLTAILYSAQAGKRFLESGKLDSGQANEIFDNIIEDDKRAGGIISGVRNLMKTETREKEIFSLSDVIQDTINIYHSEAVQQNIQIRFNQSDRLVKVSGDRIQIQQVLLNLFSNAARAMGGMINTAKTIEIKQHINHTSVTVSIRNNGIGISADIKEKLFRPFSTTHKSGLGIGLSISRAIIERHGGSIRAENIKGGGAEFSFTLKVVKDE